MSKHLDNYAVIPDRPPSLDEEGHRPFIIPDNVKGHYRRLRTLIYSGLVVLFLVVPWTKFAGMQTILLNIADRRFVFFGTTFFSHDMPYIFFFFTISVFTLLLVTALFGRLWCGWACPQTVFIDLIYRRIEQWTEGGPHQRRRLGKRNWDADKVARKSLKWFLYFLISSHIAHSFTAYFVGAEELLSITLGHPEKHWGLFLWVQIFTGITLVNFGWFREQFCLIVCPYGRFQSVLMDDSSKTVAYDFNRGEPRREPGGPLVGDCINCNRCVAVCPTGIDIRNGNQMECIACTSCIDACNEIMRKIKRPEGLIRYASEKELSGEQKSKFRLRPLLYSLAILTLATTAGVLLSLRKDIDVKILRATDLPYRKAGDGSFLNHFKIHAVNQSSGAVTFKSLQVISPDGVSVIAPTIPQKVEINRPFKAHFFAKFPQGLIPKESSGKKRAQWQLLYESSEGEAEIAGEILLVTPARSKAK